MMISLPAKILIVEDSIVSAMLMEASINRKQPEFTVHIRKSLRGALAELALFRPHIVILDLSLPDSPPEETIAAIPLFREIACVLAVSGRLDLRHAALDAGAIDFMAKALGEDGTPLIDRLVALLPQCSHFS
jgi:two-component system KDP operon response regulator KdpE